MEGPKMNRSKNIGTAAETAVVNHCKSSGFPGARRVALAGALDRGDVSLTDHVILEVKAGVQAHAPTPLVIEHWMAETEAERVNACASHAFLVTKSKGHGAASVDKWHAYVTLSALDRIAVGRSSSWWGVSNVVVRLSFGALLQIMLDSGLGGDSNK
jgi:hypothetical protein